jgi:hypothetical protein
MTPTLSGRIQTRIALLILVGVPWTFLIGPVLPGRPEGATLGDVYEATLTALLVVAVVGIAWELVYHGLQQFRWEKDWPTLFGLVLGIPEGVVAFLLLDAGIPRDVGDVTAPLFITHFATVWILVWLVANGPMRVPFSHWRFRGGRLL